ncbi:DUF4360 domain-containing protein [Streptomyces sp. NPDC051211]|uniref:DUF4360 domain-containing protein n=1 Tax=Streptomyces sp. NPDC051211 TaxID=3154643 RepID=UPI00344B605B
MIRTPRSLHALTAAVSLAAAALATTALASSAGAATPRAPEPADKVTIDVASVNGSGCRPGSASVAVAPDNTAFTVTYSEYLAKAGADTKLPDGRKNCQLSLRMNVPQGYTYAVAQADYRGYANLAKGASGTQKASYYFQGMSESAGRSHKFDGALDDNWQVTDRAGLEAVVWSPCGAKRNFNINTEMRVDKGTSDPRTTSFMAMDSTDGSINTMYHFSWKKCPTR